MRQRKIKNLEQKLRQHGEYLIAEPETSEEGEIFLEIGCGKGQFIAALAERNPDKNYIAIEGQESVIIRALEKAKARGLANLKFISGYVNDIGELFDEGALDGIYLNFSDPWPKERHAKRRLTHIDRLRGYMRVLKNGGFIAFKTDNDSLFEFTMEQIENGGFEILEFTRDLHASEYEAENIATEYEDKFASRGKNINYVKIRA